MASIKEILNCLINTYCKLKPSKIEGVVFPNVLDKNPEAWKENSVVVARGKINDRDGSVKFICDEVRPLALVA